MRDTNYQFCEVCRLQGYKRMSQLVKNAELYVATPEVKEYTGATQVPLILRTLKQARTILILQIAAAGF